MAARSRTFRFCLVVGGNRRPVQGRVQRLLEFAGRLVLWVETKAGTVVPVCVDPPLGQSLAVGQRVVFNGQTLTLLE